VAAFEPTLKNGSYLNDCQEEEVPFWASSDEQAEKLWKLTEELIAQAGEKKQ
jgi:uncharacterized protein YfeS